MDPGTDVVGRDTTIDREEEPTDTFRVSYAVHNEKIFELNYPRIVIKNVVTCGATLISFLSFDQKV